MSEKGKLTPEDDFFGRVALFNKLVSQDQVNECAGLVSAELESGGQRRSLASVLVFKGYLGSRQAAAIQRAIAAHAARTEGLAEPAAKGLLPEPRPMSHNAPAGDSRIDLELKRAERDADKRFVLSEDKPGRSATLSISCSNLHASDSPAFEAACANLVKSKQHRLTIDLTEVEQISSVIIGDMGRANVDAMANNQLLVIRAQDNIIETIRMLVGDFVKTVSP